MLVNVAFDFKLDNFYSYSIPAALEKDICVGSRVEAFLGRSKRSGYVVELDVPFKANIKYKSIISLIDNQPIITAELMKLSQFMASYYNCSIGQALKCFLPAAVRKRTSAAVEVFLVRLKLSLDQLKLESQKIQRRAPRQAAAMAYLISFYETSPENSALRLSELVAKSDTSTATIRALEKKGWIDISREKYWRDSEDTFIPSGVKVLTDIQKNAVDSIKKSLGKFESFLLHGVTGSGKTEVYLQVIKDVIDKGQGAIILVPEIALTPQTVERFRSRFGTKVALLHSDLTEMERCKHWWSIRDGHAKIVVGARSAIFAPVQDLGLIVVDEEHERTYKQSEEQPRYNARDVAVIRAKLQNCPVVLGSATPSLESFENVRKDKYTLLELPERVVAIKPPEVELIDIAKEIQVAPQLGVISRKLKDAINQCLEKKEQVLLFLNRRGYCPVLSCPDCSYVKSCDNCSISLTYHSKSEKLLCHLCGYQEKYRQPYTCPSCRQKLTLSGFGTQRVEKTIAYLFPEARIGRMDRDTTERRGSHERILSAFGRGDFDILLGTQMIAKGLDFPNVTLVGVINADTSLHAPDFRANETTFQLVTQVAGRSGRGEKAGKVIVQSFSPDNSAITCAVNGEWKKFAEEELETRKLLSYPPYSHLIHLLVKGKDESTVVLEAEALFAQIARQVKAVSKETGVITLLGPSPAPLALAHGYYRWQIIIKAYSVFNVLNKITNPVLKKFKTNKIQIIVDVDPL